MNETQLLDYFSGNLSDSENRIIEEWIAQSEENKKIASDIYYLHYSTQVLDAMKSIDTQNALKTVKNKIYQNRRKAMLFKLQRIAAILLLPLVCCLSYFIYLNFSTDSIPQYVEMRTNPGMTSTLTLPDGSQVWLNSDSKIKYPLRFGKERVIELEGEAFFDVTKDQDRKFIVSTNENFSIEVLGTKFNIEAYENKNITATLVEGKVRALYNGKKDKEQTVMNPSQKIVYDIENKTAVLTDISSVSPDIAWKDGVIVFENTSFKDALNILSKHFNVSFIVENKKLYDNHFTGKFSDESLDVIIKHFSISSNIKYKSTIDNNKKVMHLY